LARRDAARRSDPQTLRRNGFFCAPHTMPNMQCMRDAGGSAPADPPDKENTHDIRFYEPACAAPADWHRCWPHLVAGFIAPGAAEEGTVEAFSSFEASGHIYPTGPEESTFVGVLSGILDARDAENTIDAGLIMCPGTVTIDTTDGSQHGTAKCVIVTPESNRVFGSFECEGVSAPAARASSPSPAAPAAWQALPGAGRSSCRARLRTPPWCPAASSSGRRPASRSGPRSPTRCRKRRRRS
jgi:hypothetical protein